MTDLPVSVVIPTYNRRSMVLQAVESVKRQTVSPQEIIVVSDGCTDGTPEAVHSAYPDVVVFRQDNYGETVARNTGIALAKGAWVALLDADDLWHPRKLERVADFVSANPEAEAVCHPNWYFSVPDGPSEHVALHRDFTADSLDECIAALGDRSLAVDHSALGYRLAGNFEETLRIGSAGLMSSAVVRRILAIRAGVCPPQQSICGDWSFVVNVARLAQWAVLPERLSFCRFHSMQVSGAGCAQALFAHCVAIGLWYGGRPLRRHLGASAIFDELARYGANYRNSIQGVFWYAVRKRDWHTARLILAVAELLLPRLRDRLFVHIPPQITWRWERYILGMHK